MALTAHHKTLSPPPPALQYGWKNPTVILFGFVLFCIRYINKAISLRAKNEITQTALPLAKTLSKTLKDALSSITTKLFDLVKIRSLQNEKVYG